MWVYGDLGTGAIGADTVKMLKEKSIIGDHDAIFHIGDIAYDMDFEHGVVGNTFMNEIQSIGASFPYMVGFGNHDFDNRNNTNYRTRFSLPKN